MSTFLLTLSAVGGLVWLQRLAAVRRAALIPVRVERRNVVR